MFTIYEHEYRNSNHHMHNVQGKPSNFSQFTKRMLFFKSETVVKILNQFTQHDICNCHKTEETGNKIRTLATIVTLK